MAVLDSEQQKRLNDLIRFAKVTAIASGTPDEKSLAEIARLTLDRQLLEKQHTLASEYVPKVYEIIKYWLIIVVVFVFFSSCQSSGFNNPHCQMNCLGFSIPEKVLITFIGATTATVLGLFYIVAKWLYPATSGKKE